MYNDVNEIIADIRDEYNINLEQYHSTLNHQSFCDTDIFTVTLEKYDNSHVITVLIQNDDAYKYIVHAIDTDNHVFDTEYDNDL